MATLDVLNYVVLADQAKGLSFSRQTGGWEATAFDVLTSTKWTRVKNSQGWPWDRKLYDTHVYDWITEQDWLSSRDYKKNVQNHLVLEGNRLLFFFNDTLEHYQAIAQ